MVWAREGEGSMTERLQEGDSVCYTNLGYRVAKPPERAVRGVVVAVELPSRYLVRWPMGLGYEDPKHITKDRS